MVVKQKRIPTLRDHETVIRLIFFYYYVLWFVLLLLCWYFSALKATSVKPSTSENSSPFCLPFSSCPGFFACHLSVHVSSTNISDNINDVT